MAKYNWITADKGIRYREHETRKHGIRPDRYYTLRYYVNGKRIEESLGWASEGWTLEKARIELAHLKEDAKLGHEVVTLREKREKAKEKKEQEKILATQKVLEKITLNSFWIEHYLPVANLNKKPKSIYTEKVLYQKWIENELGQRPIKEINIKDLYNLIQKMKDDNKSPRTIEYCISILSQIWNHASTLNFVIGKNPVTLIKKSKFDNRRVRYLTKEEATLLLETLRKNVPDIYDMAILSLFGGLRLGEIMSLRWADINFEHKTITILDPKNSKNRHCFINQQILSILQKRYVNQTKEELIFPSSLGTQRESLSKSFARIVKRLKLNEDITDSRQKVVFHTLRHTFASWLVQKGTPLYTVAELMGHSTLKMTQRYAHLAPNNLENAASSLDDVLPS